MDEMEEFIARLSEFQKPDLENVEEITSAEYFYDPQCHIATHEQIINDSETVNTFKAWIEDNAHIIKGKNVLDVGCGTGIFSLMAAKAGAARVISVEWSNIVEYTKRIVKENSFEDVITVIRGRIDQIKLPHGIKKVDVIISFWMGYALVHGGKLKAVIHARDKFLKPNGHIVPDRGSLYISGIADDEFRENNIDWWNNVYGYDMSFLADDALIYARHWIVSSDKLCTNKCEVKSFDLKKDSYVDILKPSPFQLTVKWNDYLQGFCTHFCVKFSADTKKRELSTDPLFPPKMWGQTVFYFKDYAMIKRKEKIIGTLSFFNFNDDSRYLGAIVAFGFTGQMDQVKRLKRFVLTA